MSIKTASMGAAALVAAAVFAGPALADGLPGRGKVADAPAPRCTTSANIGYTTDYVFRGVSQSNEDAAVQGGVDFTCGNFYVGTWGSSIEQLDATAEIDIYGGYKMTLGRFALDFGFIYYAYPGQDVGPDLDFLELKAAASFDAPWKGGTLGGTLFYSPEYTGETGAVVTYEGTFSQALPKFSIFTPTFSATVGYSDFLDGDFEDLSYMYWNVGVTLGFLEKWSLDLRYWDTDGDGFAAGPLGDDRFLGTIKYTF